MKPFKLTNLLWFALLPFISCQKQSGNCRNRLAVNIIHDSPVVEGWPLRLEAEYQSTAHLYKWSGPNGWKKDYETFSSDAYLEVRENITLADAGEYKLQMVNTDGCIEYEGTTMVEVIAAPSAPCNIPANSSISSALGVGEYSFNHRTFQGGGGHYLVSGVEILPGGDYMRFAFLGDTPPLAGTYKTSGYFGNEPGKVGLYISTGTYDFVANPNQTVYVNKVNNKLQISFCSVLFNNPLSPANPITISANIVQP